LYKSGQTCGTENNSDGLLGTEGVGELGAFLKTGARTSELESSAF
jgi:hypothetical protein